MMRSLLLVIVLGISASAGEADVLKVEVSCRDESVCDFSVTVRHADQGWEHYANRWEILDSAGEVIAIRKLGHPHDDEQPFTRTLENVAIPRGLNEVRVRAHDLVHGYGGKEVVARIPREQKRSLARPGVGSSIRSATLPGGPVATPSRPAGTRRKD